MHGLLSKNKSCAVVELFYFLALSFRGIFSFHGTQTAVILCLYTSMEIWALYECIHRKGNYQIARLVCAGLTLFVMIGYIHNTDFISAAQFRMDGADDAVIIDMITDNNEAIGQTNLSNGIAFTADRAVFPNIGGVPWLWDVCKGEWTNAEKITDLPRVIVHTPEYEVWGYKQSKYAPELIDIVNNNYTFYETTSRQLYIRNDYYDNATKKIESSEWYMLRPKMSLDVDLAEGKVSIVLETKEDYDEVFFPVWSTEDGQDDLVWHEASKAEDGNWHATVDLGRHYPSEFLTVEAYGKKAGKREKIYSTSIN